MKKELENLLDDFALANIEEYPFEFEMTKGYYSAEILSLFEKTIESCEDDIYKSVVDGKHSFVVSNWDLTRSVLKIIKDKIKDKSDYKLTAES